MLNIFHITAVLDANTGQSKHIGYFVINLIVLLYYSSVIQHVPMQFKTPYFCGMYNGA